MRLDRLGDLRPKTLVRLTRDGTPLRVVGRTDGEFPDVVLESLKTAKRQRRPASINVWVEESADAEG